MAENSRIEWTDATWNPTTGCTKISPGCAHCYIDRTPPFRMAGRRFEKGHIPLQFHEDRLGTPFRWKKPRRVFVNSLSDLFHADVPDEFIDRVFAVMALSSQHTFQVLTKRPERMGAYFRDFFASRIFQAMEEIHPGWNILGFGSPEHGRCVPVPIPNVWLGVSVENRQHGLPRIDVLRTVPAALRFLSIEPLLEDLGTVNLVGIHWVVLGGESGHDARPMNLAWARSLLQQCRAAGVPAFFKQLGSRPYETTTSAWPNGYPHGDGSVKLVGDGHGKYYVQGLRDRKGGGDPAEWPADLRVRQSPAAQGARR